MTSIPLVVFVISAYWTLVSSYLNDKPCYFATAPRSVRPAGYYKVAVFLCGQDSLIVKSAITVNNQEIDSDKAEVAPFEVQLLTIRVPKALYEGEYKLQIEGTRQNSHIVFRESKVLEFNPKFLSIVVQTNRPVYRASQTIYFRVIVLYADLRPYDQAVEITIKDPDGFILRRWISVHTNSGVASLRYTLPQLTKDGIWKIAVKALSQVEEQKIKVETFFMPLFEVFVQLPPYIPDTDDGVTATIFGGFSDEKTARGNISVQVIGRKLDKPFEQPRVIMETSMFTRKQAEVYIPMSSLEQKFDSLSGLELSFYASMTESLYGETSKGFCKTQIITSAVQVKFLTPTPAVFKPGMPFHVKVLINNVDNEKIPEEVLEESKIRIQFSCANSVGGTMSPPDVYLRGSNLFEREMSNEIHRFDEDDEGCSVVIDPLSQESYLHHGVLSFYLHSSNLTESLSVRVEYQDSNGNSKDASLKAIKYHSVRSKYLGVWSSTQNGVPGEYAVFHVKSNFWIPSFQYLVISKGEIVSASTVTVEGFLPTTTTFTIPLSPSLAPGFRLLVFHASPDEDVLADSVFVPILSYSRYKTDLVLNRGKDHIGNTVEVIMGGEEGSFIGVNSMRSMSYALQAGNELTEARFTESFLKLEPTNSSFDKVIWRSRDGLTAETLTYFQSIDRGWNANRTVTLVGLIAISSKPLLNSSIGYCGSSMDGIPCLDGSGCFSEFERCDGNNNCQDASDEYDCPPEVSDPYEVNSFEYKVNRTNHVLDFYDAEIGNWGWLEIKRNDHRGREYFSIEVPGVSDDWYFTGFSVNAKKGFSIVKQPILYSTNRLFIAQLTGPEFCRRGEQVAIRLILENHDSTRAFVLVQLLGSPDYKFVHVEEHGIVSSYAARLSSGEHQVLVYIPGGEQEQVDIPIAPTVEQGEIEIRLVASTQAGRSDLTHNMQVLPEGATVDRHTSVMLDLKNRAFVLSYLDIVVEESPIVPYQEWRRYIYGSPRASISVTGDIIGPILSEFPFTKYAISNRPAKGTDARMLEFAVNIWSLHYLRLTNQLDMDTLKYVLDESNTIFGHIMKRFDPRGWFTNWDLSPPSVWLTAWVIRLLKHATYADWENILYIDNEIFERVLTWLIYNQTPYGSFQEVEGVMPLDTKIISQGNITLTAHVLITLCECSEILKTNRSLVVHAILSATKYLESSVNGITDPYQLAVTSYALLLAQSNEVDILKLKLDGQMKATTDGLYYWSKVNLVSNPVKIENQRPFLQPRQYQEGDTEAVETTAYALLVQLGQEGVNTIADKVVQWLNSVRMTRLGFISTTDTIVAIQALTEYANRARLLEITKIDVQVVIPSESNEKHIWHIGNKSQADPLITEINNVWGHANIEARGSGLAMVQLDVSYGIDHDELKDVPTVETFQLKINEYYSTFRNKSAITIESCFRWIRDDPPTSGAAILEIDIPTGYMMVESDAEKIARSGNYPYLRDGQTMFGKTVWFFDKITKEKVCFNHTVRRWFAVANMTLYRQALLYETNARERFVQVVLNSTSLYVLNICEVCGSYQCPYCPYYNSAIMVTPKLTVIFSVIFTVIIHVFRSDYSIIKVS